MKELGRCKTMQFSINLIDETPVYWRRHRLSKHEWELVDERCKKLHEVGFIQPSSSNFVAAIIMPAKKDLVGLWTKKRMCGDYRPLNLVTPEELRQIVLAVKDHKKTTFHGSNKLWEWLVMLFGLKNAPDFF